MYTMYINFTKIWGAKIFVKLIYIVYTFAPPYILETLSFIPPATFSVYGNRDHKLKFPYNNYISILVRIHKHCTVATCTCTDGGLWRIGLHDLCKLE